ncbi:MAG TPA: glycosyltransferase family A protein [Patescibacteria group bacterium]
MSSDAQKLNNAEVNVTNTEKIKIEKSSAEKRSERLNEINRELISFNGDKTQNVADIENKRNQEFENKMHEMGMAGIPVGEDTQGIIYQNMVNDSIEHAQKENERFDSLIKEKKVVEYLNEVLPETEERIGESMDERCEVSVVIPAYGEREYILRPMETLAEQKGVLPEQYEVIFVINNPGAQPEKKRNETDADLARKIEHYNKALIENQQTLDLVRYINGEDVEVRLSEKEVETVKKIKASGIRIFVIDKASEGKTLKNGKANVGGARNRGVAEAVARFYEQKKQNGIIAQTDADTRVDKNYIHNIIEFFQKRPELVGAAGELKFEQVEKYSSALREASTYAQFEYFYWLLSEVLSNERMGNKIENENILMNKGVHFSGANMLSRAFESAIAGGVPEISGGEDPEFGRRLAAIGQTDRTGDVLVMTADRFSPRTDVNAGHGQQKIRFAEAVKNSESILVIDPNANAFIRDLERKIFQAIKSGSMTLGLLEEMTTISGQKLLNNEELNVAAGIIGGTKDIQIIKDNQELKAIGEKFRSRIEEIFPKVPLEEASERLIEIFLKAQPELREEYEKNRDRKIEKENEIVRERITQLNALLDVAFEIDRSNLDEKSFIQLIDKNKDRIGIDDEGIKEIQSDEYVLGVVVDIIRTAQSRSEAFENWKEFLRSDFLLMEEYSLKRDIICLKSMLKIKSMLNGKQIVGGIEK